MTVLRSPISGCARRGTVRLYTSEATWLMRNKTVLAWLWDDNAALTPSDQQFVRE